MCPPKIPHFSIFLNFSLFWVTAPFSLPQHLKIDYTENLIFFKEYYIPMQTQLSCTDIVKALFTVIGYYNKVFGSGTKLIVSGKLYIYCSYNKLQELGVIILMCIILSQRSLSPLRASVSTIPCAEFSFPAHHSYIRPCICNAAVQDHKYA